MVPYFIFYSHFPQMSGSLREISYRPKNTVTVWFWSMNFRTRIGCQCPLRVVGCLSTHPCQRLVKARWRRQTSGAADTRTGLGCAPFLAMPDSRHWGLQKP